MRSEPAAIVKAVDQVREYFDSQRGNGFGVTIGCVLLAMLQWDTQDRPDFVSIEYLVKYDLLPPVQAAGSLARLDALYEKLVKIMLKSDSVQSIRVGAKQVQETPLLKIYRALYADSAQFLKARHSLLLEDDVNVKDSYGGERPSRLIQGQTATSAKQVQVNDPNISKQLLDQLNSAMKGLNESSKAAFTKTKAKQGSSTKSA